MRDERRFPNEPTAKIINLGRDCTNANMRFWRKPPKSHQSQTIAGGRGSNQRSANSRTRLRLSAPSRSRLGSIGNWKLETGKLLHSTNESRRAGRHSTIVFYVPHNGTTQKNCTRKTNPFAAAAEQKLAALVALEAIRDRRTPGGMVESVEMS